MFISLFLSLNNTHTQSNTHTHTPPTFQTHTNIHTHSHTHCFLPPLKHTHTHTLLPHTLKAEPLIFSCVWCKKRNSPCVNFNNILRKAFTREDPKSAKDIQAISLFALLESARIKDASKHVGEIDPFAYTSRQAFCGGMLSALVFAFDLSFLASASRQEVDEWGNSLTFEQKIHV